MNRRLLLISLFIILMAPVTRAADVEYSTTGVMDTPATHGGDRDFWGSEFITYWANETGRDVIVEELAWPCGGWWAQFWYVWITETLPADPYTLEFYDSFVAVSEDGTEWPPSTYTYIDVSDKNIVIPAGAGMYFGYSNPGMGGQIVFNGVDTYSWLNDSWDRDGDYGRTAVLQFKGSFGASPVRSDVTPGAVSLSNHPNPFNPATTITFSVPDEMRVDVAVYSLQGHLVRELVQGQRRSGTHQVRWDGTDASGRSVPSGIYFARIVTEEGSVTRKLVVAK